MSTTCNVTITGSKYWAGDEIIVRIKDSLGWVFRIEFDSKAFDTLFSLLPQAKDVWSETVTNYNEANRPNDPEVIEPDMSSGSATTQLELTLNLEEIYRLKADKIDGITWP